MTCKEQKELIVCIAADYRNPVSEWIYEDRVYVCELREGHDGAHVSRDLMWPGTK